MTHILTCRIPRWRLNSSYLGHDEPRHAKLSLVPSSSSFSFYGGLRVVVLYGFYSFIVFANKSTEKSNPRKREILNYGAWTQVQDTSKFSEYAN